MFAFCALTVFDSTEVSVFFQGFGCGYHRGLVEAVINITKYKKTFPETIPSHANESVTKGQQS